MLHRAALNDTSSGDEPDDQDHHGDHEKDGEHLGLLALRSPRVKLTETYQVQPGPVCSIQLMPPPTAASPTSNWSPFRGGPRRR